MKSIHAKVAAITGAGSGIGRATAELFARRGCRVALSDVNEPALEETARLCRAHGVEVRTARVDVAQREAVHAWADDVARALGAVHIVVNNAGVALSATLEDTRYEDFEWLMNINFWGVVHGTKAFLPHLKAVDAGHIVNVSSVFGLIAVPTQGAYNAAKFAVRGFTEALRQELEVDYPHLGVTCVHPGGIKTNIARSARYSERVGWVDSRAGSDFDKLAASSPERAAADILSAILGNRRRQLIGGDALVIDLAQRLMPTLYQRVLVAGMRYRRRRMPGGGAP